LIFFFFEIKQIALFALFEIEHHFVLVAVYKVLQVFEVDLVLVEIHIIIRLLFRFFFFFIKILNGLLQLFLSGQWRFFSAFWASGTALWFTIQWALH
jgi:hypothetical protein